MCNCAPNTFTFSMHCSCTAYMFLLIRLVKIHFRAKSELLQILLLLWCKFDIMIIDNRQ